MTLTISSDISYKYFEVTTKDKRFERYPLAFVGGWNRDTYCTCLDKMNWFKDMEAISEWVKKELTEECLFQIY